MKKLAMSGCISLFVILITSITVTAGGLEPEIEEGDTRAFVIEILGEPDGVIGGGAYELLHFERGAVELVNGKVKETNLVSEQEAAERKIARLEAREKQRQEAEAKAKEQAARVQKAEARKPAPVTSTKKEAGDELTEEQRAELDKRIAEGMDQPPYRMSKRAQRRYRRGRSPSLLERREQQITDEFMAELAEK